MTILHLDENHPLLIEELSKLGHENKEDYESSLEQIIENIGAIDGIVIRSRFKINNTFLDAAKDLKFIARVGAGLESIDIPYAHSKGVTLFSAPEGNRNAVGEHALGMLLCLFNKLISCDHSVKEGTWLREAHRGLEVEGKTIGLIGYGNMGKAFAKKLKGFDCNVIFYDIKNNIGDDNATQVTLEELKKQTDVLSLHTPWTPLTDKMIDRSFINSFAKSFWIINTARGKSVVTKDLVVALKAGKVLGAGLDVLEFEKLSFESLFALEQSNVPPELNELLQMKNVLLSPHVAGWTIESNIKLAQTIVDKIGAKFG